MNKIIITGALGYLGTELCKIYSGESWKKKIIAVDCKFVSERVKQLNDWGIEFVEGNILDKNFVKNIIKNSEVIFHLAGVTDVAYVKSQVNSKLDKKIFSVGVLGTRNILDFIPKTCKLIFPSSHVLYEGLKEVKKNLTESTKTCPVLRYAKVKNQNEIEISKRHKNYVIMRLGSVYGYSSDSMRINIMPNLFSKISSLNGEIRLFSQGIQYKSLVNLIDVVRCMKFLAEDKKIKNEIFHITNEQVTVKEVAKICKKINPKVKIVYTKEEVPNKGYTLSNKKILDTGFEFLYNLEDSIREIINNWKFKNEKPKLEYIFQGNKEFVDSRGIIKNYELPEAINLIGYIESKKNTIRANHFHPIQEQKCMLIKGQFISVYKDLLSENSNIVTHVVNEGDLIVTKPNVAHTMVFSKNSIFLNLVRGEREHKNYGITHTKPYILVDEILKKNILNHYKFECRSCLKKDLKRVLSLGMQPLANNLISQPKSKIDLYPLEMNFCPNCYNCQLSVAIPEKKLFNTYLYTSSTSGSFVKHFELAAKKYIKKFYLKKKSFIIDIGSNDGIALRAFKNLGYCNILGIEPAKNISKLANQSGIKTLNSYLNLNTVKKIKKKSDLILASNVFAHSDNLKLMAECILKLLSNSGVAVIEVQYLVNMIKELTFDNIYHEHYNYWSLTSLCKFFQQFKVKIFEVEKIKTHGGSIRVYISKNLNIKVNSSVKKILREEARFGIKEYKTYQNFEKKILNLKKNVITKINNLKKNKNMIIGYGSPAKATTALNYFGINNEIIDFIIEDNKLKHNKFVPLANIPIKSKNNLNLKNAVILVLAWNFFKEIKNKNKNLSNNFVNFKSLF